jgi:NADP-dependent 3-hydroxy acid dehydrogenase YdfG
MIAKKYVSQNINGRYIWFSSILANECRPYQSVYGASKKATEYAFTNWNKEYPSFKFVNLRLGRVKTGHLYNTFEQTKTKDQCDAEYDLSPFLTADYVANEILKVLTCDNSLTMEIKP